MLLQVLAFEEELQKLQVLTREVEPPEQARDRRRSGRELESPMRRGLVQMLE